MGSNMQDIRTSVEITGSGAAARNTCAACRHDLGPAAESWKAHARRRDIPLTAAGGAAYDNGDPSVMLRQFCCPACATLLDTETAMPGDPVLADRLLG